MAGPADLVGKLRELGLSEYEAKIYAVLLKGGPARVSDVAVRARVPRTKAYEAIRSLEKKGLARSYDKPRMCAALDAEEALGDFVAEEEKRLERLRAALDEVKKLRAKRLGSMGEAEGRYLVLGGNAAAEKLGELLLSASRSFHGILDYWGLELLSKHKRELDALSFNGVDVKLVVVDYDEERAAELDMPPSTRFAALRGNGSAIAVDTRISYLLDSGVGAGVLIDAPQVAELVEASVEDRWSTGFPLQKLLDLIRSGIPDASAILGGEYELVEGMKDAVFGDMDRYDVDGLSDHLYSRFLKLMPEVDSLPVEAAITTWTALLRGSMDYGSIRYDPYTKIMIVEYDGSGRLPPSLWFLAFMGYLRSKQMQPVVVHSSTDNGRTVLQIKLPVKTQLLDDIQSATYG